MEVAPVVDYTFTPRTNEELRNAVRTPYLARIQRYGPMNRWNTEHITDMSILFRNYEDFNVDTITNWNTSKVTNMANMFYRCTSFNQP